MKASPITIKFPFSTSATQPKVKFGSSGRYVSFAAAARRAELNSPLNRTSEKVPFSGSNSNVSFDYYA